MQVTVNGEVRDTATGETLVALLASLGIDRRKVAVERNREIVPKSAFDAVVLAPGDQLEIVQFVGGG
ncbi:MAG: sulfur carrier protein ThiS [Hyphomonadaceae bacterium]|nr:MAG: thiamine biosynthesis ThiG [Caulobacteraceae bacterium]MBT9447817.1 sulfur carrier protein ThiS [Hyphomonadaceae bacterium]TPW03768.1 MAG: thiamine biosynthesis ThiG [Alphaproteobacteria bacterium]